MSFFIRKNVGKSTKKKENVESKSTKLSKKAQALSEEIESDDDSELESDNASSSTVSLLELNI